MSSASDNTPIALTNGAVMAAGETISGSVSGSSSVAVHGSTAAVLVDPTFTLRQIAWICVGMQLKLEWNGSGGSQMIGVYGGNGRLDYRNTMGGIPLSTSGNALDVLGDIKYTSIGHTSGDTAAFWVEVGKGDSFNIPNFDGNAFLGYDSYRTGNH